MLMVISSRLGTPVKATLVNCALIAVEHLGLAMRAQSILQAVHAEHRLHGVADAPAQHPPGVPVHDGQQVGKAAGQTNVGDVGTPHLVDAHHRHTP